MRHAAPAGSFVGSKHRHSLLAVLRRVIGASDLRSSCRCAGRPWRSGAKREDEPLGLDQRHPDGADHGGSTEQHRDHERAQGGDRARVFRCVGAASGPRATASALARCRVGSSDGHANRRRTFRTNADCSGSRRRSGPIGRDAPECAHPGLLRSCTVRSVLISAREWTAARAPMVTNRPGQIDTAEASFWGPQSARAAPGHSGRHPWLISTRSASGLDRRWARASPRRAACRGAGRTPSRRGLACGRAPWRLQAFAAPEGVIEVAHASSRCFFHWRAWIGVYMNIEPAFGPGGGVGEVSRRGMT